MAKALVVINEQHSLFKDQERVLLERFEAFERVNVPAQGWTLDEQAEWAEDLTKKVEDAHYEGECLCLVFASPIPALLKLALIYLDYDVMPETHVFVFHNDQREKKELPNGKVISVVAKEGWQLV